MVGCERPAASGAEPAGARPAESTHAPELPRAAESAQGTRLAAEPGAPARGTAAGIEYVETVTGGASPDERLPLVIAIHGLGDRPESFLRLFAALDAKARVVALRGLAPYADGFTWFPLAARNLEDPATAAGIREAAGRVTAAAAELASRRPTVGRPIVTGFSQGGALSYALAIHHGGGLSAAHPVGGWIPPDLVPSRADAGTGAARSDCPIVALHGEADPLVPVAVTRKGIEALAAGGPPVDLRIFPGIGHNIPEPMRSELLAIVAASVRRAASGSVP